MKQQPRLNTDAPYKELDAYMRRGFQYGRALFKDLGDNRAMVMLLYRAPARGQADRLADLITRKVTRNISHGIIDAGDKDSPLGFTPNEDVACLSFMATAEQIAALPRDIVFAALRSKGAERAAEKGR